MLLIVLCGILAQSLVITGEFVPTCDTVDNCSWCPEAPDCWMCPQGFYLDGSTCLEKPDDASTYSYTVRRTKLEVQHELNDTQLEENFYRQFLSEVNLIGVQYYLDNYLGVTITDIDNQDESTSVVTYELSFSPSAHINEDDAGVPMRTKLGETGGGLGGVDYFWFAPLYGDLIFSPSYEYDGEILLEGPYHADLLDSGSAAYNALKDRITYAIWYISRQYRGSRAYYYRRVDAFSFVEQEGNIYGTFTWHWHNQCRCGNWYREMSTLVTTGIVEHQGYLPGLTSHRVIDIDLSVEQVSANIEPLVFYIQQTVEDSNYAQLYYDFTREMRCATRSVPNFSWSYWNPCKYYFRNDTTVEMVIVDSRWRYVNVEPIRTGLLTMLGQGDGYLPYIDGFQFTPGFGDIIYPETVTYTFTLKLYENEECVDQSDTNSLSQLYTYIQDWVESMATTQAAHHYRGMDDFVLRSEDGELVIEAHLTWSNYTNNIHDACRRNKYYSYLLPLKSVKYFGTILTYYIMLQRGLVFNNTACVVKDIQINETTETEDYATYAYNLEMDEVAFRLDELRQMDAQFMPVFRETISNAVYVVMENIKFSYRNITDSGCLSLELRVAYGDCLCEKSFEEVGEPIVRYLEDRRGEMYRVSRRFVPLFVRDMTFPDIIQYDSELLLELDADDTFSEVQEDHLMNFVNNYGRISLSDVFCFQTVDNINITRDENLVSITFELHWSNCSYDAVVRIPWSCTRSLSLYNRAPEYHAYSNYQLVHLHIDTSPYLPPNYHSFHFGVEREPLDATDVNPHNQWLYYIKYRIQSLLYQDWYSEFEVQGPIVSFRDSAEEVEMYVKVLHGSDLTYEIIESELVSYLSSTNGHFNSMRGFRFYPSFSELSTTDVPYIVTLALHGSFDLDLLDTQSEAYHQTVMHVKQMIFHTYRYLHSYYIRNWPNVETNLYCLHAVEDVEFDSGPEYVLATFTLRWCDARHVGALHAQLSSALADVQWSSVYLPNYRYGDLQWHNTTRSMLQIAQVLELEYFRPSDVHVSYFQIIEDYENFRSIPGLRESTESHWNTTHLSWRHGLNKNYLQLHFIGWTADNDTFYDDVIEPLLTQLGQNDGRLTTDDFGLYTPTFGDIIYQQSVICQTVAGFAGDFEVYMENEELYATYKEQAEYTLRHSYYHNSRSFGSNTYVRMTNLEFHVRSSQMTIKYELHIAESTTYTFHNILSTLSHITIHRTVHVEDTTLTSLISRHPDVHETNTEDFWFSLEILYNSTTLGDNYDSYDLSSFMSQLYSQANADFINEYGTSELLFEGVFFSVIGERNVVTYGVSAAQGSEFTLPAVKETLAPSLGERNLFGTASTSAFYLEELPDDVCGENRYLDKGRCVDTRQLFSEVIAFKIYRQEFLDAYEDHSFQRFEFQELLLDTLVTLYSNALADGFMSIQDIDISHGRQAQDVSVISFEVSVLVDPSESSADVVQSALQAALDDQASAINNITALNIMPDSIQVAGTVCSNRHCAYCRKAERCLVCKGDYSPRRGSCERSNGARLYPYKGHSDAHKLWDNDVHEQYEISLPEGNVFELHCNRFKKIYVSKHGVVSLGTSYLGYSNPQPMTTEGDHYLIAPLMALTQGSNSPGGSSVVYVSVYQHVNEAVGVEDQHTYRIFSMAKEDAESYGKISQFNPTLVIVVSYHRMKQYPFDRDGLENTFQLILAMDGRTRKSFVMFRYAKLEWTGNVPNAAGMQVPGNPSATFNLGISGSVLMFTAHLQQSNVITTEPETDRAIYYYRTSRRACEGISYSAYKCLNWYNQQDVEYFSSLEWRLARCPCNYFQLRWSPRFIRSWPCASSNTFTSTRTCCYGDDESIYWSTWSRRSWWSPWLWENRWTDLTLIQDESYIASANPDLDPDTYLWQNEKPRNWCCKDSLESCQLFRSARPSHSCIDFTASRWAWMFGDPHITTIDGNKYPYNGIGEHVLLDSDIVTMQIRAVQAKNSNGTLVAASIFSACVIQAEATRKVQFEVIEDTRDMTIDVYPPHETDLTAWFQDSDSTEYFIIDDGSIIFTKINDSVEASFAEPGVSVIVSVGPASDLSVAVGSSPSLVAIETRGLLGNVNNNPEDDFVTPTGYTLESNTTEELIYQFFGQAWLVNQEDTMPSLFEYAPGKSSADYLSPPDFVPQFSGTEHLTPEEIELMNTRCGDNQECRYDFMMTRNDDLASSSGDTSRNSQQVADDLENTVPVLVASSLIANVTVGQQYTLTVEVVDSEDDSFTFNNILPEDSSFTVDGNVGTFTWTPASSQPVYGLVFGGFDSHLVKASKVTVEVHMCDCPDNSVCDFTALEATSELNSTTFRRAVCDCDVGWTGEDCSTDIDGCSTNPCGANQTCTDVTPDEQLQLNRAFTCSGCLPGFANIDGICADINECLEVRDEPLCQPGDRNISICVNLVPGYTCTCAEGYMLDAAADDFMCIDVDECDSFQHSCTQLCVNTDGSYSCDCYDGYSLDDNDEVSCVLDDNNLDCREDCMDFCISGSQCGCRPGTDLMDDGITCQAVDECSLGVDECGEHSSCNDTDTGYVCVCDVGYSLNPDGWTCTPCEQGFWGENCRYTCSCATPDTECSTTEGCQQCVDGWTGGNCDVDIDECAVDGGAGVCGEFGNCTNTPGDYICNCDVGYQWLQDEGCVVEDHCTDDTGPICMNNGTCASNPEGYECTCDTGFTGDRCEQDINECEDMPCSNNATCLNLRGRFSCVCRSGYTGQRCDIDIDECSSSPCQNSGECVDAVNGYTCTCVEGWTGRVCDNPNQETTVGFTSDDTTALNLDTTTVPAETISPALETTVEPVETTQQAVDTTVKSEETTEPVVDTTVKSQETTEPVVDTTVKSQETTEPVVDTTVKSQEATEPVVDTTVKSQETTEPVVDTTVKSQEATEPVVDTTVKSQEATELVVDTTVKSQETTEPVVDTTVKSEDTTEPSIDLQTDAPIIAETTASVDSSCNPTVCNSRGLCSMNANKEYVCQCGLKYEGERCEIEKQNEPPQKTISVALKLAGQFTVRLTDPSSTAYIQLTAKLVDALTLVFLSQLTDSFIKVDNFRYSEGSIVADYDVIMAENSAVTSQDVISTLNNTVQQHDGTLPGLDDYLVESISASTANTDNADGGSGMLHVKLTIGITVGVCVVLLVLVWCAYKKRSKPSHSRWSHDSDSSLVSDVPKPDPLHKQDPRLVPPRHWYGDSGRDQQYHPYFIGMERKPSFNGTYY